LIRLISYICSFWIWKIQGKLKIFIFSSIVFCLGQAANLKVCWFGFFLIRWNFYVRTIRSWKKRVLPYNMLQSVVLFQLIDFNCFSSDSREKWSWKCYMMQMKTQVLQLIYRNKLLTLVNDRFKFRLFINIPLKKIDKRNQMI
jgi:hypothetical protein